MGTDDFFSTALISVYTVQFSQAKYMNDIFIPRIYYELIINV